jgi:hypothetical protein
MLAILAIPSKRVLAGRIAPLGSASAKITSAPSSAADMAALRPAADAPATRTSQFTGGGGTEDEIKVSKRILFGATMMLLSFGEYCLKIAKLSFSFSHVNRYSEIEESLSRYKSLKNNCGVSF